MIGSAPRLVLPTQRSDLTLMQYVESDAPSIFSLIDENREHLSQFGDDTSLRYPCIEAVIESIRNPKNPNRLRMGIWHNTALTGTVNLAPENSEGEIGYYLGAAWQGRGFALEAVRTMTTYAWDSGLRRVIAYVALGNDKSAAVLVRAGYEQGSCSHKGTLMHKFTAKSPRPRRCVDGAES